MQKVGFKVPNELFSETEEVMFGDAKITLLTRLSSDTLIEFAREYVQMSCAIDDEEEIAYSGYNCENVLKYLVIKYFSNIDIENLSVNDAADIYNAYGDVIRCNDVRYEAIREAKYMARDYAAITIKIYEETHSIRHKIALILNRYANVDPIQEIAESREINEKMIDILHASEDAKTGNIVSLFDFKKKDKHPQ